MATKSSQPNRPPKPKKPNPISTAITKWLDSLPGPIIDRIIELRRSEPPSQRADISLDLVLHAPKRWVVYHPMVLFPAGSFGGTTWDDPLRLCDEPQRAALWSGILAEVAAAAGDRKPLTHLAVNEGIPAQVAGLGGKEEGEGEEENYVRRPEGLRMLYGDFGPVPTEATRVSPTEGDFERAFWVRTTQNGISQTWAPRYTMFSRGNVKEKARLLGFHEKEDVIEQQRIRRGWAVDLYAGIGYFAFSYAKLGMRVLCWEINPWSVEALRRGATANGWGVKVVLGEELNKPTPDVVFGGEDERIIVFLEDNRRAASRIEELRNWCPDRGSLDHDQLEDLDIVHVNCGLLPYSTTTWKDALASVGPADGWLHLHENVGAGDIDGRREEIRSIFDRWLADEGKGRKATVTHVERVKTFAPGVWHCVFDVYVLAPKPGT